MHRTTSLPPARHTHPESSPLSPWRQLRSHGIAVAALLCLSLAGTGLAEEPVALSDMVVTASRTERAVNTVPASVTVITAEDIAHSNAQTVPELLKHQAGVEVSDWYGTGRFAGVDLRGFGENANMNTLVLVDGRRINREDANEVDWSTIPLERIERIEVVRGGNSVLYGDRAVGGVINIRTKKGAQKETLTSETTVGSYGAFKQALGYAGSQGPLSYAVNSSYSSTDGYRENSYFRNKTTGLSLSYDDGGWFAADLAAGAKRDRYGMPGGRWPGDPRRGAAAPSDYAETDQTYVQFTPTLRMADGIELSIGLSHSETEPYYVWGAWEGDARLLENGVQPKLTIPHEVLGFENEAIVGVDFHDGQFNLIKGLGGDMDKREAGYYINDTLAVVPDQLFLDAGYRRTRLDYNFAEGTGQPDQDGAYGLDSYRAGLTWAYAPQSKAFVSIDRSFRSVLLQELGGPGFNVLLPPQTAWQYQVGVRHTFGPLLALGVTAFQIDTDDEIFFDPLTYQNVNYDKTRRRGFELEAESKPHDSLRLFANYTWMAPELLDGNFDGKQIPGVAARMASAGATWSPLQRVTLNLRGRWINDKMMFSDWSNAGSDWEGESYFVVDAHVSYRPLDWLELFVGVNNVFNREYSEYGGWFQNWSKGWPAPFEPYIYPAPERNFTAGARITKEF